MVRGDAESAFETAYFVMKPQKCDERKYSDGSYDMIYEAERIVEDAENIRGERSEKKRYDRSFLTFVLGFSFGAGFAFALCAVLCFFV